MKYNEVLKQFGISKKDFENAKETTSCGKIKGKVICHYEQDASLCAYEDGGVTIENLNTKVQE